MANGYIYIMTNPALKGMVKIGYANTKEHFGKIQDKKISDSETL